MSVENRSLPDRPEGRVVVVEPRGLEVREQQFFERATNVSLLIALLGAAAYFVGPFAGEVRAPLTVVGCAGAGGLWLMVWVHRRDLRARLDANGVDVSTAPGLSGRVVRWSEVVGYRDDRPDAVVLSLREGRFFRRVLAIPTHTERDRVAVLAHLDGQGIPRLDG